MKADVGSYNVSAVDMSINC